MPIEIKNAIEIVSPWTAWFLFGPTGCIAADAFVHYQLRNAAGRRQNAKGGTIERLYYRFNRLPIPGKGNYQKRQTADSRFFVCSMDEDQRIAQAEIAEVVQSGVKPCVRVTTVGGLSVVCTADHPFATTEGYKAIGAMGPGALVLVHRGVAWSAGAAKKVRTRRPCVCVKNHPEARTKHVRDKARGYDNVYKEIPRARLVLEAHMNGLTAEAYKARLDDGALVGLVFVPRGWDVHHKDENPLNDVPENLVALAHGDHAREHALDNLKYLAIEDEILSIEDAGEQMTYDIGMKDAPHNFVTEGFVVHNSRKTSAAATFPWPIFIVPRNEQSIMTLRGRDIPYIEVDTPDDMNDAITYLEMQSALCTRLVEQGKGEEAWAAFPYQTVVVESLSHYTDMIIEALTGTKGGWQQGKMDQQKWGHLSSHLRSIHTRLRALPAHMVYTALATVKENDATGVVEGGPLMSGAMAMKLPSACDAIGYCEVVAGIGRVHFQRFKQFPARVRVPQGANFPAHVDDFSWAKVAPYFGHEG